MTLQDIFLKPVDRHIDGVIKADDNRSLVNEVEEYVLTREVQRALDRLVDQYLHSPVVNSVWISGFFGSGKSHLLKMLALLLENRQIDGHNTLDMFLPKLANDVELQANVEKASKIPSKSILFNIAQKANIVNKDHSDALLGTFIKVFNEMCGYYGNQGYIAQFERDLDDDGLLVPFKKAYEAIANKAWERGRELPLIQAGNISKAYAKVTGANEQESKAILEKYRTHYQMSIEDFADMVNDYIEKQEKGFRLNFFVDEVGQYIANSVRLMVDLQTISESLATRCKGRAWLFVTAQEDYDSIVGRLSQQGGNELSKIQDRFKVRVKLSSANVDEVIRLRLLAKNDMGKDILESMYGAQQTNLKTLFDLPDGAKKYKNFKDREHFVSSYPFIPYQFTLFQSAIQNLSKHDAFTGQYQSVGERSMLEVFQFVVKEIARGGLGKLATFDLMYEGIRDVIKSEVVQAINQCEEQMDDEFTKRVLKILFLVKYVREFQSTPRNLAVLLIELFDTDPQALRKKVEESLGILEEQTYIKRSDDVFEYLTNKERDIENEIKNTDIDPQKINEQTSNLFYNSVLNVMKIRYEVNDQDFPFTRRLDYSAQGKVHELGVHVLTNSQDKEAIRVLSLQHNDLIAALPDDYLFQKENRLYLQTDTYIRQNASSVRNAEENAILTDKSHQNQERFDWLKRRAKELLGSANMYVMGDDIQTEVSDAKSRIAIGFQKLIQKVYPNLAMLGEAKYEEKDISKHLAAGKYYSNDDFTPMSEAEQDILNYVVSNRNEGVKTTLYSLLGHFEKMPYGWSFAAILCLLARLYGMSKVEVILDGKNLEDSNLEKFIRNSSYHNNIIIVPTKVPPVTAVKKLKVAFNDTFHKPPASIDAKALGNELAAAVEARLKELEGYTARIDRYPFLSQLLPVVELLKRIQGKSYDWYYDHIDTFADALPDVTEDVVDPIIAFMHGQQRNIYDEARKLLNSQQYNLQFLDTDEGSRLEELLNDPTCFQGTRMAEAWELTDILKGKLERKLKATKEESQKLLEQMKVKILGMERYEQLTHERMAEVEREFSDFRSTIEADDQISMIKERYRNFAEKIYPTLVSKVQHWTTPLAPPPEGTPGEGVSEIPPRPKITLSVTQVPLSYGKALINSPDDLQEYLEAIRSAFLAELEKGNNIHV